MRKFFIKGANTSVTLCIVSDPSFSASRSCPSVSNTFDESMASLILRPVEARFAYSLPSALLPGLFSTSLLPAYSSSPLLSIVLDFGMLKLSWSCCSACQDALPLHRAKRAAVNYSYCFTGAGSQYCMLRGKALSQCSSGLMLQGYCH
jgi:hypothetical protein